MIRIGKALKEFGPINRADSDTNISGLELEFVDWNGLDIFMSCYGNVAELMFLYLIDNRNLIKKYLEYERLLYSTIFQIFFLVSIQLWTDLLLIL